MFNILAFLRDQYLAEDGARGTATSIVLLFNIRILTYADEKNHSDKPHLQMTYKQPDDRRLKPTSSSRQLKKKPKKTMKIQTQPKQAKRETIDLNYVPAVNTKCMLPFRSFHCWLKVNVSILICVRVHIYIFRVN